MSAFFFYISSRRGQLKAQKPDLGNTEIVKLMGDEWKAMTNDAKSKYEKLASDDKARYEKELAAYNAKKPDAAPKKAEKPAAKAASKKKD